MMWENRNEYKHRPYNQIKREESRGRTLSYRLKLWEGFKVRIELVGSLTVVDTIRFVGDEYLETEKSVVVPLGKVILVELAQDEDTTEDSRDAEDYDRCYDDYDYWEWE